MTNRAPLVIAIVLLLLPLLYIGSYLAMADPAPSCRFPLPDSANYRGRWKLTPVVYYPLERLDRQLRPDYWNWEEKLGIEFE